MTSTPAWSTHGPARFAHDLMRWENERRLTLAASGAAFWLCLAAFPAAIAVVNILGLVVPQEEVARIVSDLALLGSTEVGRLLETQLEAVAAPSPGTLLVDTGLVLLALWSVSRAMRYLIDAIRAAHGMPKRSTLPHYAVSLAAGLLAVLGLGVISYLAKVVGDGPAVVLDLMAFAVAVALVVALYATALGRTFHLRAAVPGVALCAAGFVIVVIGTWLYVAVAGDMKAIYGTLGGIVLAMLFTWFVVFVILLGASVGAHPADVVPSEHRR